MRDNQDLDGVENSVPEAPGTVQDRPTAVPCGDCGSSIPVGLRGPLPTKCGDCAPDSRAARRRKKLTKARAADAPLVNAPGPASFAALLGLVGDENRVAEILGLDEDQAAECAALAKAQHSALADSSPTGRQALLATVVSLTAARLLESAARLPPSQIAPALRSAVDALERVSGGMLAPTYTTITIDLSEKD